jgi:hypothetical protein
LYYGCKNREGGRRMRAFAGDSLLGIVKRVNR